MPLFYYFVQGSTAVFSAAPLNNHFHNNQHPKAGWLSFELHKVIWLLSVYGKLGFRAFNIIFSGGKTVLSWILVWSKSGKA
jgi:hypothetical protein